MFIWAIVIISAIWVLIDAKSIGVKKGIVTGMGDMGPTGWFLVTLLIWIIGFPMYLYYRGKFKLALAQKSSNENTVSASAKTTSSGSTAIEDLEKLASLKEKGLITESEFEAKKKQLLNL